MTIYPTEEHLPAPFCWVVCSLLEGLHVGWWFVSASQQQRSLWTTTLLRQSTRGVISPGSTGWTPESFQSSHRKATKRLLGLSTNMKARLPVFLTGCRHMDTKLSLHQPRFGPVIPAININIFLWGYRVALSWSTSLYKKLGTMSPPCGDTASGAHFFNETARINSALYCSGNVLLCQMDVW